MDTRKQQIVGIVASLSDELFAVSDYLLQNPETAYEEYKACKYLGTVLEQHGFDVQKGIGDVETAFVARPANCAPTRPTVALLAEYDALPKIGHGCGHNLIAAASLGAAITLRRLFEQDAGSIAVVGTPAEEGGGGKVRLAEAGVFDEMDAAMMFHPGAMTIPGKGMLGRIKFKIEIFGQTAHASGSPDQGINALDALIQTYNSINALRQHMRPDGRIHGIITDGGDAPNIIPDYSAGLFYVRAGSVDYRDELFDKVVQCCKGASLATGARYHIDVHPPVIDPMKRNPSLEAAVASNLKALDIPIDPDNGRRGSSDMGNLSHYLPTMASHGWIAGR